ncbi:ethanolamine transporter [Amphibacillus marinus]|uniref:Ethanolamine transporter n=1 Tax=Amphibacillus marinus TaxID=872970 RepID=A0A1H8PS79_9BACI|nr:ethanolamine utilization protein EutH [Amphibacillus marinus]SEO44403.1 ethanolamine transporter [Amphibacillus marinus]
MNDLIMQLLAIFLVIGALDLSIGNRFGLGEAFKKGVFSMGPLALAMIGIITLSPIIAELLIPVITPIYTAIGADPASFANTLLAIDMGGYVLAESLALSPEGALFAWVFLGTMLGPTIVFTIPVALGIIEQEDHDIFAKGILIGLSTVPLGCFTGGLLAGFDLTFVLLNLIIPVLFSIIIIIGLYIRPRLLIKCFIGFGKVIMFIGVLGLALAGTELLTGVQLMKDLIPYGDGLRIVGTIAMVLAGAYPLVTFITKLLDKPLMRLSKHMAVDQAAVVGFISCFAHSIPAFVLVKDMTPRGKLVIMAFSVSGAFVIGGHLGFVAEVNPAMVVYMIAGKLVAGFSAALIAFFVRVTN